MLHRDMMQGTSTDARRLKTTDAKRDASRIGDEAHDILDDLVLNREALIAHQAFLSPVRTHE